MAADTDKVFKLEDAAGGKLIKAWEGEIRKQKRFEERGSVQSKVTPLQAVFQNQLRQHLQYLWKPAAISERLKTKDGVDSPPELI